MNGEQGGSSRHNPRGPGDPSGASETGTGVFSDALAARTGEVTQLATAVTEAAKELRILVKQVSGCVAKFAALHPDGRCRPGKDVAASLGEIASCIKSVAQRAEEVSALALVSSSESLSQVTRELHKAVGTMALRATSADEGPVDH